MSYSSLAKYYIPSPFYYERNGTKIDTITIHCMGGNMSAQNCGTWFQNKDCQAASNYGVDSNGIIACYVDESKGAWSSCSKSNDTRAVTIEVANSSGAPDYPVTTAAFDALINLVTDVCYRNGIKELLWKADKSLIGQVNKQNMTVHRWFANKACPGNYLYSRMGEIANKVNANLKDMGVGSSTQSSGGVSQMVNTDDFNSAMKEMTRKLDNHIDEFNKYKLSHKSIDDMTKDEIKSMAVKLMKNISIADLKEYDTKCLHDFMLTAFKSLSKDEKMDFIRDARTVLQDNDSGTWSDAARKWAVTNELVQGGNKLPDGSPNYMWEDFLTREQMVTILYRDHAQK